MGNEADDGLRVAVVAAIRRLSEEGCPVAGHPEDLADVAVRRWRSSRSRLTKPSMASRIQDLAKGLIEHCEHNPKEVGPLKRDYEHVAECIAPLLVAATAR